MYTEVVVLTYQAPGPGYFIYKVPQKLKVVPGHLVRVPFGKRTPLGIVLSTGLDPARDSAGPNPEGNQPQANTDHVPNEIQIKEISEIVLPHPFLPPYQIDLLRWMADYYQASLVNCLEAMMPDIPKRTERLEAGLGKTLRTSLLGSASPISSQTLVLVPSISRLPEIMAKYPTAKSPVIYHSQLKTSQKFDSWIKILNDQTDFIFGSRSAIFSPCPNIKKIIIYDEHDIAYKDERSPYFDTLTIAEKLQELTGAKLEIYDSAPKITTYYRVQPCIRIEPSPKAVRTFIVDMKKEREAQNYSPISSLLADFVRRNCNKGGKTLLFLNKKVESGQFYCKNCSHQAYITEKPNFCPLCKKNDFFFRSINLFTVATEVKKLTNITPKLIAEDKIFRPFYSPSLVDIATSYIFYSQTFHRYQLIANLATDSVLANADFNSAESLYAQITNLKKLLTENGVLTIQTYQANNSLIKFATQSNYPDFYKNEINERKKLAYPPYSLLVKLTLKGKDKTKISTLAKSTAHLLLRNNVSDLSVLGPYESYQSKVTCRYNIILKKKLNSYSLKNRETAMSNLKPLLALLPKDWQITVEPGSLN